MSSGKTLSHAVAFGVESSALGLGGHGTETAQRKGSTIGDNVVVHFLSITVWSDAGSKIKKIKQNKTKGNNSWVTEKLYIWPLDNV